MASLSSPVPVLSKSYPCYLRWQTLADVAIALRVHTHTSFSGARSLCIHIPPLLDISCSQLGGFLFHSSPRADIYEKHRKSRTSNPCGGTAFLDQSLKMNREGGQGRLGLFSHMAMSTCARDEEMVPHPP